MKKSVLRSLAVILLLSLANVSEAAVEVACYICEDTPSAGTSGSWNNARCVFPPNNGTGRGLMCEVRERSTLGTMVIEYCFFTGGVCAYYEVYPNSITPQPAERPADPKAEVARYY